jgi:hypothetical protein
MKFYLLTCRHFYVPALVVAVTAISPIELFRTRLQAAKGVDGFASMYHPHFY